VTFAVCSSRPRIHIPAGVNAAAHALADDVPGQALLAQLRHFVALLL